jgi:hypothetical protein
MGVAASAVVAVLVLASGTEAARDLDTSPVAERAELVVYEAPSSIYCQLFRRDVLPGYQASRRAKVVPIRFVDITDADLSPPNLVAPVSIVPTVVVLRDGQETGRITGYTGPDNFFQMIASLLGPIE